jgi:hypothetical protein
MARVYLFGSGRFLGFSLMESGDGLPPGTGKRRIPLTSAEFTPELRPTGRLTPSTQRYHLARLLPGAAWPTSVLPAARRHPT